MCTVTYIPTGNGVLLTSNRDERVDRAPAEIPAMRLLQGNTLVYPKDPLAGGTWIVSKGLRDAAVLLNGGFENHIRQASYRKSRGVIMLEIVGAHSPADHFQAMLLDRIEPFTLILFIDGTLTRCTWDGIRKHRQELDAGEAHIWASATLYDREARTSRERSFRKWLGREVVSPERIFDFHLSENIRYASSDTPTGEAPIQTVSVTCIDLTGATPTVHYHDVEAGKTFTTTTSLSDRLNSISWKLTRFLIRARSWEYWPFSSIYLPMVPAWLWLSMKARSLLFFSAANPGIQYSGFIHERKSRIYPLLPEGTYPETVVCNAGIRSDQVATLLADAELQFPLIAKPDIGQRGMQVKLLRSIEELDDYRRRSRVDFLLQRYIDYPNEAGIFYYRIRGAAHGQISGIVGKEFLSVTGDGHSDLLSLIRQNERAVLQLPALAAVLGHQLLSIPAADEKINLVPYGNHCRGSKFTDLSYRITPALTLAIDQVCGKIAGFYFGRLDIRFQSWDELEAGTGFSIIEVNGAGSEPTHIYDPRHSIFFAWKEIYRHWKIVWEISMANARNGAAIMTLGEGLKVRKEHNRYLTLIRKI